MANADDMEDEISVAPPQKKGGRAMMFVAIAALVLVGAGGYLYTRGHGAQAAVTPPKAPELFLPLDPAFVVNFQDQDATRYLQVGVTVMT
ncbi:flagellar basal body-associated FliL family protein, partial [Dyella sp.]|uniref:flagellar basal body-associated FliL family protein n=1 Tax=Dyella sp. TaxID=1869338 RepID=UPI002D19E4FC|nr:flagellar basal body protein FliL [Dyella sp.]